MADTFLAFVSPTHWTVNYRPIIKVKATSTIVGQYGQSKTSKNNDIVEENNNNKTKNRTTVFNLSLILTGVHV